MNEAAPERFGDKRRADLEAVPLFGAICADRGVSASIIMPAANTEAMNEHLMEISTQVAHGAHAALVLDGAGWHQTGGALRVPDNITLPHLPPYAPELNPVENVRPQSRTAGRRRRRAWGRSLPEGSSRGPFLPLRSEYSARSHSSRPDGEPRTDIRSR